MGLGRHRALRRARRKRASTPGGHPHPAGTLQPLPAPPLTSSPRTSDPAPSRCYLGGDGGPLFAPAAHASLRRRRVLGRRGPAALPPPAARVPRLHSTGGAGPEPLSRRRLRLLQRALGRGRAGAARLCPGAPLARAGQRRLTQQPLHGHVTHQRLRAPLGHEEPRAGGSAGRLCPAGACAAPSRSSAHERNARHRPRGRGRPPHCLTGGADEKRPSGDTRTRH